MFFCIYLVEKNKISFFFIAEQYSIVYSILHIIYFKSKLLGPAL